ncbi:MAG: hypothetical protein N4A36_03445 [Candidatus Gracilibacteria bacterium]|jgi:hypothetical protein|nr:hypothetical protein [Candidatus Gracilibacteria bacterium]
MRTILLGVALFILSAVLYSVHFYLFKDAHHIFIFLLGDIAFIPIEVFLVGIVIEQILKEREKRAMLEKLNMVIGVFFSEMGTELLENLSKSDHDLQKIKGDLLVNEEWTDENFAKVESKLKNRNVDIEIKKVCLIDLKKYLYSKRDFLVKMLENPVLLEHETFTELLRAVMHLEEELFRRNYLDEIQKHQADFLHLKGDTERAYNLLMFEWVEYMKHLKNEYPYLFSFAMRTNPFDDKATIEVK